MLMPRPEATIDLMSSDYAEPLKELADKGLQDGIIHNNVSFMFFRKSG